MHYKNTWLILCFTPLLYSCSTTAEQPSSDNNLSKYNTETITQPDRSEPLKGISSVDLTLKQIMSDPDWLGRQPESPAFAPLSDSIVYQRKREGSVVRDYFTTQSGNGNGEMIALDKLHQFQTDEYIDDKNMPFVGWIFEGNVFVKDRNSGNVTQLTRDNDDYSQLAYFQKTGVSVQNGNSFFAIDIQSGLKTELLTWQYADKPQAVKAPKDYIAQEQLKLIDYVNVQQKNRTDREQAKRRLKEQNASFQTTEIYLDKSHRLVLASLSPNGKWALIASTKDSPTRSKSDIMPDYIEEDGRIASQSVRQRVADAKPVSHQIDLVNVATGEIKTLSYKTLPGYNDDVLADVKRENAKAQGKKYTVNRLPRDIGLLFDWYATEDPIKWHSSGEQAALMLEAWDNKDRWIVSLDPKSPTFVTQHRMQDKAWINYRFNQFGWFNDALSLYYLSEETGYAQLYVKPIDGKQRAITQGRFVVDDVYLSKDDSFFIYKANKKHPGIYEIYRHQVSEDQSSALTALNGMTDYEISPTEQSLVLTHSKLVEPPELYTLSLSPNATPTRLTNTVSDAFSSIDWVSPSVVAIPSSHTEQPIYSRVYLPEDVNAEKRRAVVFNHGAGYLQNSHLGWSGYFREFMFHSFLVKQGYVVLDMDYRASAGYGRDWRTAIYRHMGISEVQDNVDGVNWLVDNANVDKQRVGTYGGSYGGFLTFMALFTEPELYKAGAALRPVTDWAHYNTPYTSNILNTPSIDPIAYERSSPIYFAEGLQEALLINAPMVDNNVFFVDVVRLVQRLIELEKENYETAIYPVEPHGFVQPSSWLDEYRRIYKLFEDNL